MRCIDRCNTRDPEEQEIHKLKKVTQAANKKEQTYEICNLRRGAVKKAISFFIIPLAIRKHTRLKASMLQDLEKGKKTEVDSINGAVCAQSRRAGVPTPMNDKVVDIIHRIEKVELTATRDNIKRFRRI